MLARLLNPFLVDFPERSPWRWFWMVVVLGTPLALLTGVMCQQSVGRRDMLHMELSRKSAIQSAIQFAQSHGVDASSWKTFVDLKGDRGWRHYLNHGNKKQQTVGVFVSPPSSAVVLLLEEKTRRWVKVALAPDGRSLNFQFSDASRSSATSGVETDRGLAYQSVLQRAGPLAANWGEPLVETTENEGSRRFSWSGGSPDFPMVEWKAVVQVQHGAVSSVELTPILPEGYLARTVNRANGQAQIYQVFRSLLIIVGMLYAGLRYTRRAVEKEAPHGRTALLITLLLGFAILLVFADPYMALDDLNAMAILNGAAWTAMWGFIGNFAFEGMILGIGYGAGEGDMRLIYPGKLTSLDSLLTGRAMTRNVGVAVTGGAALASWIFCLYELARLNMTGTSPRDIDTLGLIFSPASFLIEAFNSLAIALFLCVLGLLLPMIFLRHAVRWKRYFPWILLASSLVNGDISGYVDFASPLFLLQSLSLSLSVVLAFYAADFLTASVAGAVFLFLMDVSFASQHSTWFSGVAPYIIGFCLLSLIPFAIATWTGPSVSEEEVRPPHARNLAQRLALHAELSAAREAQGRLLPRTLPEIAGLSVAASCTPAREVSGDFYDAFLDPRGDLMLVLAEGGNDGLASALTIALTKGYVLYESSFGGTPAEILARLEGALGSNLNRESGRTSLALMRVGSHTHRVEMARVGSYPRVLRLSQSGSVDEPSLQEADHTPHVTRCEFSLSAGDSLLFFTDGLPRRLNHLNAGTPEALLLSTAAAEPVASAGALHSRILERLRPAGGERNGADLADDITAVVIRLDEEQSQRLEEVA